MHEAHHLGVAAQGEQLGRIAHADLAKDKPRGGEGGKGSEVEGEHAMRKDRAGAKLAADLAQGLTFAGFAPLPLPFE